MCSSIACHHVCTCPQSCNIVTCRLRLPNTHPAHSKSRRPALFACQRQHQVVVPPYIWLPPLSGCQSGAPSGNQTPGTHCGAYPEPHFILQSVMPILVLIPSAQKKMQVTTLKIILWPMRPCRPLCIRSPCIRYVSAISTDRKTSAIRRVPGASPAMLMAPRPTSKAYLHILVVRAGGCGRRSVRDGTGLFGGRVASRIEVRVIRSKRSIPVFSMSFLLSPWLLPLLVETFEHVAPAHSI